MITLVTVYLVSWLLCEAISFAEFESSFLFSDTRIFDCPVQDLLLLPLIVSVIVYLWITESWS